MVCFSSFPSLLSSPGYHQGLLSVTSELASERSPGTPRRAKRGAGGEAVAFWLGWWLRVSRAVLSPCCHSATRQSLDWEKQDVRRPIYLRAWQTKAKIARAALDFAGVAFILGLPDLSQGHVWASPRWRYYKKHIPPNPRTKKWSRVVRDTGTPDHNSYYHQDIAARIEEYEMACFRAQRLLLEDYPTRYYWGKFEAYRRCKRRARNAIHVGRTRCKHG